MFKLMILKPRGTPLCCYFTLVLYYVMYFTYYQLNRLLTPLHSM